MTFIFTDIWYLEESRGQINIKMSSYQYRKSHWGDKTILWPSYLHNGISYTGKTASSYWIGAQLIGSLKLQMVLDEQTSYILDTFRWFSARLQFSRALAMESL